MPSVYGRKYVWSVEDAEGPSHDREGTSDARRVMFRELIETEHGEKKAGDHLTWGEVIDLWIDDRDFRAAWMASFEDFRDVNWGTGDYYWECAPVKSASLGARYEHVVKDKGARRGGAADEEHVREHFDAARNAGKIVATFRRRRTSAADALIHRRRGRSHVVSGWGRSDVEPRDATRRDACTNDFVSDERLGRTRRWKRGRLERGRRATRGHSSSGACTSHWCPRPPASSLASFKASTRARGEIDPPAVRVRVRADARLTPSSCASRPLQNVSSPVWDADASPGCTFADADSMRTDTRPERLPAGEETPTARIRRRTVMFCVANTSS